MYFEQKLISQDNAKYMYIHLEELHILFYKVNISNKINLINEIIL